MGAHFFILPIFRFLFLSSLKFEMEEEKEGKWKELRTISGAKKTSFRLSTKQGLSFFVQ